MKIKSIKEIESGSKRYDIQTTTNNFFANEILVHNSMISAQPSPYGFRLVSKAGVTSVAMNAEVFVADKSHYAQFIRKCIQKGTTPLFEWCSNKNRVVISYPEDNLILTGMRYNNTGSYLPYEIMKSYASSWDIPVVKAVDGLAVQNIELFVNQVREWESDEGVVIRFDSGRMVKIKADDYVLRHRSKDAISQEKNVIDCILGDAVDDLVPLLTPEDGERLRSFQGAFWKGLDEVALEMAELFVTGNTKYPDKKDFAVEFVQKKVSSLHAPIMYAMKGGKGSKEVLIDMIGKSLSSQLKIDTARWMFNGINWNYQGE
jgi:RNA ligase